MPDSYDLPPGHMLLEASWQDLSFHTGYVSIRPGAQKWSGRFPVPGSQASFSKLRGLYRFSGAQKLLLEMRNNEIRRVLNREVMEHYFHSGQGILKSNSADLPCLYHFELRIADFGLQ